MKIGGPDYIEKYLLQLVGKKIGGIVKDESDTSIGPIHGLKFDDGSVAWIMMDPEGNGPGFLEIQK